jgi:hypothetical protein
MLHVDTAKIIALTIKPIYGIKIVRLKKRFTPARLYIRHTGKRNRIAITISIIIKSIFNTYASNPQPTGQGGIASTLRWPVSQPSFFCAIVDLLTANIAACKNSSNGTGTLS